MRQFSHRLLLAVTLFATTIVTDGSTPDRAHAGIADEAQKVAAAFISVPTPVGTGIAAAESAYAIATWLNGGDDTIEARITSSQRALTVDVGFTYQIEWEVTYSFADNILAESYSGTAENVFVEIYLIVNGTNVTYYKRIPEQGYFTNPDAYFDDSQAGKVTGHIQFGVQSYDPAAAPIELKLMAVMYNAKFYNRHDQAPYGGSHGLGQSHHFISGHGLEPPTGFGGAPAGPQKRRIDAVQGQLALHAPVADDAITITVENPFSIEEVRTDRGKEGNHGDTFVYEFRANMGYRSNYPGMFAFPPSPPRADVEMAGFGSANSWIWQGKPSRFEFPINSGAQSADSKIFSVTGKHDGPPHGAIARYETPILLEASGRNRVVYEQPRSAGRQTPHEYEWRTVFKRAPNVNELLPVPFAVADRSSGVAVKTVDVLIIGGNHYPVSQFGIAQPDNCNAPHWHSQGPVRSLEGTTISADPAPTSCGHGRVSEVPRATVPDPRP